MHLNPDWVEPLHLDFWLRIGVAMLCGGVVGLERQLRGKPAGIRTSILVCVGTAMFVTLGVDISTSNTDPTRVLGQVITGIGFLGAGVILTRGELVHGVTTAAVIWILAAIGAAVGFGHFGSALALSGVTLLVLAGVRGLERGINALRSGGHADDPDGDESERR